MNTDNGRLVWITREQVEALAGHIYASPVDPRDAIIEQWDAAPADPAEAVQMALEDHLGNCAAVGMGTAAMEVLGMPQRPTPRDEAAT